MTQMKHNSGSTTIASLAQANGKLRFKYFFGYSENRGENIHPERRRSFHIITWHLYLWRACIIVKEINVSSARSCCRHNSRGTRRLRLYKRIYLHRFANRWYSMAEDSTDISIYLIYIPYSVQLRFESLHTANTARKGGRSRCCDSYAGLSKTLYPDEKHMFL